MTEELRKARDYAAQLSTMLQTVDELDQALNQGIAHQYLSEQAHNPKLGEIQARIDGLKIQLDVVTRATIKFSGTLDIDASRTTAIDLGHIVNRADEAFTVWRKIVTLLELLEADNPGTEEQQAAVKQARESAAETQARFKSLVKQATNKVPVTASAVSSGLVLA